jgi:hypothetical protein
MLQPPWRRRTTGARRFLVTASAVALASGLAACGSSKSSSTSSTPSATVASTTSSTATASSTTHRSKTKTHKKKTTTSTSHTTTTTHTSSTTTHTSSHTTTTKSSSTTVAYARPIHATLVGENHHPIANKLWPYTVTANDANGRPLTGTVDVEFTFSGTVVGHASPPTDPLKDGRWHDSLTFPSRAIGEPIDLQVVVHTQIGSVTLDWPVKTVKK